MQGGWAIDKAYYHNKRINYNLYTNYFELYKNHTCFLPIYKNDQLRTNYEKGIWDVYQKNDTIYLHIKTINIFFNRTFKVSNYRTVTDSISFGQLIKATLSCDSLKLECTKAPN